MQKFFIALTFFLASVSFASETKKSCEQLLSPDDYDRMKAFADLHELYLDRVHDRLGLEILSEINPGFDLDRADHRIEFKARVDQFSKLTLIPFDHVRIDSDKGNPTKISGNEMLAAKANVSAMAKLALRAPGDPRVADLFLPTAFDAGDFEPEEIYLQTSSSQKLELFQLLAIAKVLIAQPSHPLSWELLSNELRADLIQPFIVKPSARLLAKRTFFTLLEAVEQRIPMLEAGHEAGLADDNNSSLEEWRRNALEKWNDLEFPWGDYLNNDGSIKSPIEFSVIERYRELLGIDRSRILITPYSKYKPQLEN